MKKEKQITTIFLDIGGVLLTDGWNRESRKNAAIAFKIDHVDMEDRHHLNMDILELDIISMDEYLKRVVFYKKRNFTCKKFREFIYAQSQPHYEMIKIVSDLKEKYGLKVAVVSNESRELTEFRIKKFELFKFVDFFFSSCFVHLRKPDIAIFKMALDSAQIPVKHIVYIEDQPLFVQIAKDLGIKSILHRDYNHTVATLKSFGLNITDNK
jgi:putative hydrolase of the HAD superfamily